MTNALITCAEFVAAFGVAGLACWWIDRKAMKKQADWQREGNVRRW